MNSYLDSTQIVNLYKGARNKSEEVVILAELTASDIDTVVEVLRDANVFNEDILKDYKQCAKCGGYIPIYRRRKYCRKCGEDIDRERRREAANRRNRMRRNGQ